MEFIKLWKRRKVIFRIFHRCLYMNIKNTILFFFFISRLSSASHVWVCVLWCVVVCATSKKNKRQQEKREERKKNKLKLVYSEFVCRRQRRQRRLLRRIGGKARWLLFVSAYCYIYAESVRKRNKNFFFRSFHRSVWFVCIKRNIFFLFIAVVGGAVCRCHNGATTNTLQNGRSTLQPTFTRRKNNNKNSTKCNLHICPSEIQYADCVWSSIFNSDFRYIVFFLLCFIYADRLWCTQAIIKIIFSFDWTRCGGATAAGTL